MTKEQINASLDAMLENPKAKTFLNHLVRAYMPESNVTKPYEKPTGDYKCVLTRAPLICEKDLVGIVHSELFQNEVKNSTADSLEGKNAESIKKLIGDRKPSVTGKDTTTFMSYEAYQIFADWIITKSLNGDKHINWLLGGIRRASFVERAEKINDSGVQNKVEAIKKATGHKSATFSLSDSSDALSKLKAKLEANEK